MTDRRLPMSWSDDTSAFDAASTPVLISRGLSRFMQLSALTTHLVKTPDWVYRAYGKNRSSMPSALPPKAVFRPEAIPSELKKANSWVGWDWGRRGRSGRWRKYPISAVTGDIVRTSADLCGFDVALEFWKATGIAGLGYSFIPGSDVVVFDLDECIDETGTMSALAFELASKASSYAEISPSGEGIHIFVCASAVGLEWDPEIFHETGFITVTGNRLQISPQSVNCPAIGLADIAKQFRDRPTKGSLWIEEHRSVRDAFITDVVVEGSAVEIANLGVYLQGSTGIIETESPFSQDLSDPASDFVRLRGEFSLTNGKWIITPSTTYEPCDWLELSSTLLVYLVNMDLALFDRATGKLLWYFDWSKENTGYPKQVYANDRLYCYLSSENEFTLRSLPNNETLLHASLSQAESVIATSSVQYLVVSDAGIQLNRIVGGDTVWQFNWTSIDLEPPVDSDIADPVLLNSNELESNGSRDLCYKEKYGPLVSYNQSYLVRSPNSPWISMPGAVVTSSIVFIMSKSGHVVALSLSSGEELWRYRVGDPRAWIGLADGTLIVATRYRVLGFRLDE